MRAGGRKTWEEFSALPHSSIQLMAVPANPRLGDSLYLLWRSKISSASPLSCAELRSTLELPPRPGDMVQAGIPGLQSAWVCELRPPSQQEERTLALRELLSKALTKWGR